MYATKADLVDNGGYRGHDMVRVLAYMDKEHHCSHQLIARMLKAIKWKRNMEGGTGRFANAIGLETEEFCHWQCQRLRQGRKSIESGAVMSLIIQFCTMSRPNDLGYDVLPD
jgi:hypothetical protein